MDRNIEKRITLQPYTPINYINLTNTPLDKLRNPGIGIKIYDVMLPLYGTEKFETKKNDVTLPGSFEESKNENVTLKQEQEGFGEQSKNDDINNTTKIEKLGSLYSAMQKAKIKTGKFVFNPIKKEKKNPKSINFLLSNYKWL